ncbi:MAG: hypothetical protein HKN87_13595 [Saprospiraceae bacterium]|nr:hypothetical protein [Saprospiraceae bacterium]
MKISRRSHFRLLLMAGLSTISPLVLERPGKALDLLEKAGNADSEAERYLVLKELLAANTLDKEIKAQLEALVSLSDQWINGKEKYATMYAGSGISDAYLCGFFTGRVSPDKWLIEQIDERSPLYPMNAFYQARMLIAEVIERGELSQVPAEKKRYYDRARVLLQIAAQAYPNNELIQIYLGKRMPWNLSIAEVPAAPQWAAHQRTAIMRLRNILIWWVENRQTADGQFGGGWGDDVEMWRKWIPILLAFEDPPIEAGQRKLAEGLFATDRIKNGYSNKITDVEHTAEDTGDSITSMMHISANDSIWQSRALDLIDLMGNKWTGINKRGFLQFKSTYFTAEEIDLSPRKACDSVYHPRAIQPALLLWQRTKNKDIGNLVTAWMDTWVDATMRHAKGKPAGILPSTIHWPDGEPGGLTTTWWKPGNYTSNPLYVWPSAMPMMLDTLLLTWHMTSDDKYLIPLKAMTDHFNKHRDQIGEDEPEGSLEWCVSKMSSFLPMALAKYRFLSNDTSYDDLLIANADGYLTFRITGDKSELVTTMQNQALALSYNEVVFKEEVRWTDRVFRFHRAYLNEYLDEPIPDFDPTFLYQSISGNIGSALYFPITAVRWHTPAKDFAALVVEANNEAFIAELFHFGTEARTLEASFFLLKEGSYSIQITANSQTIDHQNITIGSSAPRLKLTLPPQKVIRLSIQY